MTEDRSALDEYVEAFGRKRHALARLVARPDAERGTVHTPREIAQQPFLWRETACVMERHAPALQRLLSQAGLFDGACRPYMVLAGAGTSDYVGLALADLLRVCMSTPCFNWPTTRITASPAVFLREDGRRSIMLHFARSGNSPESKAALELALDHVRDAARHVVITCNEAGELARLAEANADDVHPIVLPEACNDKGLAMTSSFSNMVVAGQALCHLDDMGTFMELVDRTSEAAEFFMDTHADTIFDLAAPDLERVYYLGNNDLLGAATESALKAQELTGGQIASKGEDTLAFRHGPISAVDEHTMVCFFLSEDEHTRRYELDVLLQYQEAFREIGARTVVVAARAPEADLLDEVEVLAYDPEGRYRIPALYQVNLAVLFGQLFGVFAAYRRKLNVDDPSTSKALYSRTVQGVRLYTYVDGKDDNGDNDEPR